MSSNIILLPVLLLIFVVYQYQSLSNDISFPYDRLVLDHDNYILFGSTCMALYPTVSLETPIQTLLP